MYRLVRPMLQGGNLRYRATRQVLKKVAVEDYLKTQKDTKPHVVSEMQEILNRAETYDPKTARRGLLEGEKPVPVSPMLRPIILRNVKQGKKLSWCSCGLSITQPICDGSHKGTAFRPKKLTIEEDTNELYMCGCKLSKKAPFCDGTTCQNISTSSTDEANK